MGDEHEDSINDGFFFLGAGMRTWGWSKLPASRHRRGANFSFADGHVETRIWQDRRTIQPVTRNRIWGLHQPNNPDVHWIHDHATAEK